MPGVTLHLHLAERSLECWRRGTHSGGNGSHSGGIGSGGSAPFPLDDPAALQAFRQGAFGPDLGYFPGGPTPLSDLAHAHRTGDLCRALVGRARTAVERAFAWGWVSHVLADLMIHPMIGCAVGELVHGSARRFVESDRSPELHGRVEAGLDAVFAARYPALRAKPLEPVLDRDSIGFVCDAYRVTYGVELDPVPLLQAHRRAARRATQGLKLAAWSARGVRRACSVRTGQWEGRLRRRIAKSSLILAYLLPAAPASWLLASTRTVAHAFPRLMTECWRTGLAELGNHNLDTGRLEERDEGHGACRRARRWLLDQRGHAGERTESERATCPDAA